MVPIILNLKILIYEGTFDNLIIEIIHFLVIFGGMLRLTLLTKLCVLVLMVIIVFEGLKIGVIIQMINERSPRDALYGISM